MKLPKELTTVTPLSKLVALIMFVTLPIIFFFGGVTYQKNLSGITQTIQTYEPRPSPIKPQKLQPPPYGKVVVQGKITTYDVATAVVDGAPLIKLQLPMGKIFEIIVPSGESACNLSQMSKNSIATMQISDLVEVYGTAATDDRIIVCNIEDYLKILKND